MPQDDPAPIALFAVAARCGRERQEVAAARPEVGLDLPAPRPVLSHLLMKRDPTSLMRILALDLHPRSFGYAVFENADLLDWGLRKWPSGQSKSAGRKLCRLLALWRPMRLIVREGAPQREYATVEALARDAMVPVVGVRRASVQNAFRSSRRASRFDIARAVAERHPELALRLPALRKLGHGEPFQLRMFNAAAAGIAFLSNHPVDGGKE